MVGWWWWWCFVSNHARNVETSEISCVVFVDFEGGRHWKCGVGASHRGCFFTHQPTIICPPSNPPTHQPTNPSSSRRNQGTNVRSRRSRRDSSSQGTKSRRRSPRCGTSTHECRSTQYYYCMYHNTHYETIIINTPIIQYNICLLTFFNPVYSLKHA